jgi:hypothetical protein
MLDNEMSFAQKLLPLPPSHLIVEHNRFLAETETREITHSAVQMYLDQVACITDDMPGLHSKKIPEYLED